MALLLPVLAPDASSFLRGRRTISTPSPSAAMRTEVVLLFLPAAGLECRVLLPCPAPTVVARLRRLWRAAISRGAPSVQPPRSQKEDVLLTEAQGKKRRGPRTQPDRLSAVKYHSMLLVQLALPLYASVLECRMAVFA